MEFNLPAGTVILREGEVNMDMYKIVLGNVEVYSGYETENESIMAILSEGSYFGELGLLTQKPSIYTVVAYEKVRLLRIPVDNVAEYIKVHPEDAVSIMRNMAASMYNLKVNLSLLQNDVRELISTTNVYTKVTRETVPGLKAESAVPQDMSIDKPLFIPEDLPEEMKKDMQAVQDVLKRYTFGRVKEDIRDRRSAFRL